jgi:hypothetical protein
MARLSSLIECLKARPGAYHSMKYLKGAWCLVPGALDAKLGYIV